MYSRKGIVRDRSDAILREGGCRLTPQRNLILQVIKEAEIHLSMEQIIQRVQMCNPCVSQATVYRTLDLLQTLGLVRVARFASKHVCYRTCWQTMQQEQRAATTAASSEIIHEPHIQERKS